MTGENDDEGGVGMRDDGGEVDVVDGGDEAGVRGSLLPPLGGGVRLDGPQEARIRWGDADDEYLFVLVVFRDRGGFLNHHPLRGGGVAPLLSGGTVARPRPGPAAGGAYHLADTLLSGRGGYSRFP
jgi:hypothetical protein